MWGKKKRNKIARSRHVKLAQILKSGLGYPGAAGESLAVAPLPYLNEMIF